MWWNSVGGTAIEEQCGRREEQCWLNSVVEQWNSVGGTVWWNSEVEQCWWNNGTVMVDLRGKTVEQWWWNGISGTVWSVVEECCGTVRWNSGTVLLVEKCGGTVEQ